MPTTTTSFEEIQYKLTKMTRTEMSLVSRGHTMQSMLQINIKMNNFNFRNE